MIWSFIKIFYECEISYILNIHHIYTIIDILLLVMGSWGYPECIDQGENLYKAGVQIYNLHISQKLRLDLSAIAENGISRITCFRVHFELHWDKLDLFPLPPRDRLGFDRDGFQPNTLLSRVAAQHIEIRSCTSLYLCSQDRNSEIYTKCSR